MKASRLRSASGAATPANKALGMLVPALPNMTGSYKMAPDTARISARSHFRHGVGPPKRSDLTPTFPGNPLLPVATSPLRWDRQMYQAMERLRLVLGREFAARTLGDDDAWLVDGSIDLTGIGQEDLDRI